MHHPGIFSNGTLPGSTHWYRPLHKAKDRAQIGEVNVVQIDSVWVGKS